MDVSVLHVQMLSVEVFVAKRSFFLVWSNRGFCSRTVFFLVWSITISDVGIQR